MSGPIFRGTEDDALRATEQGFARIVEQPLTPLEIFKSGWLEFIPTEIIAYADAVNVPVDLNSFPDPWGTAIYQVQERVDMTLGSAPWVQERGYFLIALFTRSGGGPTALDPHVAVVRQVFHGFNHAGLWIAQVDGPLDTDPEANGEWWYVQLTAQFTFNTTRNATGPVGTGWRGVRPGFPVQPPQGFKLPGWP